MSMRRPFGLLTHDLMALVKNSMANDSVDRAVMVCWQALLDSCRALAKGKKGRGTVAVIVLSDGAEHACSMYLLLYAKVSRANVSSLVSRSIPRDMPLLTCSEISAPWPP